MVSSNVVNWRVIVRGHSAAATRTHMYGLSVLRPLEHHPLAQGVNRQCAAGWRSRRIAFRQRQRVAHTDFMCNSHREDFDKSGNPLPARSPRDCPTRTDSKAQIVIPPSMTSSVPTTKDETSDERYSTASAISSGSAIRFTSVWFCNHSFV